MQGIGLAEELLASQEALCSMELLDSYIISKWDRGGTVVKVLCHKSEGRWFDPS